MELDLSEIIRLTAIHPARVWNVYVYGSRVYGTYRPDSDYDILVVASNMLTHQEIKTETLNIHVWTPDLFRDKLAGYNMAFLECLYAPQWAKLQERMDFNKDFKFDVKTMKKFLLSQSHNSWTNAKMKMRDGDIVRGTKSAFHALRILNFGIQLAKFKKIEDFAMANRYWNEMVAANYLEWDEIKKNFLPTKRILEKELINAEA